MYKANTEQMLHQYTMTKDEPLFRQAKANADLLSAVSSGNLIPVGKKKLRHTEALNVHDHSQQNSYEH